MLLAGSSPELFRLHPCFHSRVDIEGLAAILLTMHSVNGRTLLSDFNSPDWQAIRQLAEPHRDRLDGLLDRDRLDEYLPPPGVELKVRNGIVDSSGRKMLVGLMLWARDHM